MVKTLSMTCPHCNHISELFLSTNACVIVLNCPSCYSPLMFFENKIFLLSKKQVDAIKGTTQNTTVLKILDRIAHTESMAENTEINSVDKVLAPVPVINNFHPNQVYKKYISEDDIMNLKIELALCNDSQSFIDSL